MFHGIYTPIVTPFKRDEAIDYGKMQRNLEKWGKTDLDGIVVLGSNGEFVYLSHEEKLDLVKFTIDHFNRDKKIIVGTTYESTKETIRFSKEVADLGADGVLVLPPHYYKGGMKEALLYQYFIDVAEECPIPLMIYNMPGNTGINLSSSLIAKLSKHPNIVGIKDTSGNIVQLSEIGRDADKDFAVFAGNAGYLLPALTVGARGATLALANILPEDCCRLVALFKEGKIEEAKELQLKILEINHLVTSGFGVPALKVALDLLDYDGGEVRRPLQALSMDKIQLVEDALKRYGAIK
ncbi:4-hydroxy-tetrahydrodipicolinate synthase [Alkaliphilus serpentinus]|uniref:4-hydroxy-tetrahydrodipicolinate synthase n=1 Tax=Alkaliphilus serpentinus TaxID=1482731 RepID=A0A833HP44_9FIRM|nr:4-hydroxy-tetrahydrodipicolinate synthase [Alkaliphilus serpentinus]KAB3530326.1 4-hydroxy-tetrahydrodipicolinate synthase [Alkaliphilus serpentinus]